MEKKLKIEKNKLYLVTGGTGFLGKSLIKRILEQGGLIRVISRNEGKLIELKQAFPSIEILTGDICDVHSIHQACMNINGIFHLAAAKHVGLAETQSRECIKTNTIGSLNILEETSKSDMDFILGISTDKAAQVSGVYGASKMLMEKLFRQFESNNTQIEYRIVRYGNVLYSTGSVLCKWKERIKNAEHIVITEPLATRYFWTVEQAIDLIFNCMENATNSSPFCPEMKSISIGDLLLAMVDKYLPHDIDKQIYLNNVKTIGLQKGENLHEKILEDGKNSNEVEKFTIEEIIKMI